MGDLFCRITPNARRHEITGWEVDELGRDILRLKLQAPPVEGKANKALVAWISELLKVPKSHVHIISGEKSRIKRLAVEGMTAEEIRGKL